MKKLLTIVTFGITILFTGACNQQDPTQINGVAIDPDVLTLGETTYANNCAACHGANLEGQANWQSANEDGTFRSPPHDETGHTWHHNDAYLIERIRLGTATMPADMQPLSNMPAYDGILTDEEMNAVLIYIKSSWPADIQAAQANR